MALPRIGFNEGSLLRRTLLHVVSFVLGSMAFIGIMSFVLVSLAKGLAGAPRDGEGDEAPAAAGAAAARPGAAPLSHPPRSLGKRGPTVPGAPRAKDD